MLNTPPATPATTQGAAAVSGTGTGKMRRDIAALAVAGDRKNPSPNSSHMTPGGSHVQKVTAVLIGLLDAPGRTSTPS
jgi:hypothetical protein